MMNQPDIVDNLPLPLHDYQKRVVRFLLNTPKAGVFLDVGFGKTITTIATLIALAQLGWIRGHILIIAPKQIARSVWTDELKKWGIEARCISLIVNERGKSLSRAKRIQLYENIPNENASFYFINRELVSDLIHFHLADKKPYLGGKKRPWPFQTVVIDELQSFKSYSAERFKAMQSVSPYITRFVGLTGTPVPNGLMDLWAEVYLMDMGARLGENITAYRNTFFDPGLTINNNIVEWKLKPFAEQAIYDRVKDIVISVKNPGIVLPDVTYNDMYCYMDDKEEAIYKELFKKSILKLVDVHGDEVTIEAKNSAVLSAKLAQMASGTLYIDTDDKKKNVKDRKYTVIHDKKLEILEYIIQNTNSPVIIAYHYRCDRDIIISRLKDTLGITVREMDGDPATIKAWNSGNIPVMLLQPASVGHGLNLQNGGHTLIWYTVPTSLEEYIQCNGRLARQGQQHPVMIHHILMHGTVDKHLRNNLIKKDTSEKQLIEAVSATIHDAGY